jgi:hypothetical protein
MSILSYHMSTDLVRAVYEETHWQASRSPSEIPIGRDIPDHASARRNHHYDTCHHREYGMANGMEYSEMHPAIPSYGSGTFD